MLSFLTFVVLTCFITGQLVAARSSLRQFDGSLGTGFDISQIKIGSSVLPKGSTIFKPIPLPCVQHQTLEKSEEIFSYYKNTADLVKTFQASAGLTPSFLSFVSLKNSLSGTFAKVNRAEKNVSGATHVFYTHSRRDYLDKKCFQILDAEFVRDFKALKKNIEKPHLAPSWDDYKYFLRKYGSHYVTQVTYGASVSQYLSAESSSNYSERDFSAKACLALAGPVHVGVVKASLCGGISKGEQNTAQSFKIDNKLVLLGGSYSTRNKFSKDPEYITMLLNEGRNYESPVSYKFDTIADMLMSRYHKTEFANQAANFKSYVEGFLNFDCTNKWDKYNQIELQKFELDQGRFTIYPQYMCTIAPEGCRADSDCHFRGKCKCRGETCVRYDQSPVWYGRIKTTALINKSTSPGTVNKFCQFSFSKAKCLCNRPQHSNERQVVWKSAQQKRKIKIKKAKAKITVNFKSF